MLMLHIEIVRASAKLTLAGGRERGRPARPEGRPT